VCEIGDVATMTARSLDILANENLPRFKKQALARAKEFDISRILPLYEDFYKKTIERSFAAFTNE
jgi:hypothetical protein